MGAGIVSVARGDGFGMVPSRYPWTPAADQIMLCHMNQLVPSKWSSAGNMKSAGWSDMVRFWFRLGLDLVVRVSGLMCFSAVLAGAHNA